MKIYLQKMMIFHEEDFRFLLFWMKHLPTTWKFWERPDPRWKSLFLWFAIRWLLSHQNGLFPKTRKAKKEEKNV